LIVERGVDLGSGVDAPRLERAVREQAGRPEVNFKFMIIPNDPERTLPPHHPRMSLAPEASG
jgi:hypothetical protein